MTGMQSFWENELNDLARLFREHGVRSDPVVPFPNIDCPACGQGRIQRYQYIRPRQQSAVMITYVWCAHCWRYHGSTSIVPDGWDLADPITQAEHAEYDAAGIDGLRQMLRHIGLHGGAA